MRFFKTSVVLAVFTAAPIGLDASQGTVVSDDKVNKPELTLSISVLPGDKPQQCPEFCVRFENVGKNDVVLNLGMMLANGKVQVPSAIQLTLNDSKGRLQELRSRDPNVAGRIDDYVLALRAGSSYTLTLSLADYYFPAATDHRLTLPSGAYRLRAHFVGAEAKYVNSDTEGIKLMPFWTGNLRSEEVRLSIDAALDASSKSPEADELDEDAANSRKR